MRIGALEAGGTKMVVAIGTEQGEILDRKSIPTKTPKETMPELIQYFKEQKIDALGIGCFGPIDLNKNSSTYGYITSTPKLAWRNFDIVGAMKKELHVPIGFDTDVNASAIGEATWGNSKDVKNSIYITIGTGVGVGVLINGKPLHGMLHPEAGHILLAKHPEDTFQGCCPYHGSCMEGLASGPAIEARYGKKAMELADQKEVWEITGFYIAQALVNYILTLSPERIILGGGVMHQEQLMPIIREEVKRQLNGYICTKQTDDLAHYIVFPQLNDNQGILGCIKLAVDEITKEKECE
ncbi:ROK family protein [Anaerosporobacter faecicola]|uniref:ROK family protein n=1 Tax=Anaerosporobacter faecicola TaxID=2718714 RepID=UPI00143C20BD|nr:ROK family protein [Anaerosporobacter faecicola]